MIKGEIIINFNRMRFDLQRFADAGSVVNATVAYVNSSTGNQTAFSGANTLAPEMKDYYNNELLENYRVKQIFTQFGRRHTLPARHKGVSEFRKVNAFNTASLLTEGAVPAGQKMGFTTVQATVNQYGTYISISDKLELRAVDDVIEVATKEMASSMHQTMEKLARDGLLTGTNVLYCDNIDPKTGEVLSTPTSCAEMEAGGVSRTATATKGASTGITAVTVTAATFAAKVDDQSGKYEFVYASSGTAWKLNGNTVTLSDYGISVTGTPANNDTITVVLKVSRPISLLTPNMVSKAADILIKANAPMIDGSYVAVIHPSVAGDLRRCPDWISINQYNASRNIFNGEIGELHGVRFIVDTYAPVLGRAALNAANDDEYVNKERGRTYATYFLGLDGYAIIDPEGGHAEMIVHDKDEIGGPLNQYSTIGYKFETNGATILYPERVLRVMSCSTYSATDTTN